MIGRLSRLVLHRDFGLLWAGQTISLFGSQVTLVAFPLVAALTLRATSVEMGLLQAAQYLPFLVFGLMAGVWVDRLRRRPIMIAADAGRTVLLLAVPAAALIGVLGIGELYVVGFLAGCLTLVFDVAYQSYLPSLVGREQLVEGNSKLELSRSGAQLLGPGLGGALVQLATAPFALLANAASYAVSAVSLLLIRTPEPEAASAGVEERRSMWREILEGLRLWAGHPVLREILLSSVTVTLLGNMATALYLLYITRTLHVPPAVVGLLLAAGGATAILGALACQAVTARVGTGLTMILALFGAGVSELVVPLAGGPAWLVVAVLLAGQALNGFTFVIWNINQLSLRQSITQPSMLGRVSATYRFVVWGAIPLGSVAGGVLASATSLRVALLAGALGVVVAPVWMLLGATRRVRTLET